MPNFEETLKEYETNDAGKVNKLEDFEVYIAKYFYEAGQSAATFAAANRAGDAANEAEKAQRLEVAISKLSARYPTKDEAEYLREVIAEAQG